MDPETRDDIALRLATASGHLRGIERMVSEGVYCIDTIQQIRAVQAALAKVSLILLDTHLSSCVSSAINSDDPTERQRMLKEVTTLFATNDRLFIRQ